MEIQIPQEPLRKRSTIGISKGLCPTSLNYRGVNIYNAANQGNLPICVLLWGMAAAKKLPVNLMAPDYQGNNPMHFACLAETPEV